MSSSSSIENGVRFPLLLPSAWACVILSALAGGIQAAETARTLPNVISGAEYQSADTRAMQADPFANPGFLWVDQGRAAWAAAPAGDVRSCEGCHSGLDAMRGVARRYPRIDDAGRLLNLTQRIERCRVEQQGLAPLPYESEPLLALTAALFESSAGLPFDVAVDGAARPHFEAGRRYFYERRGQLNLACHHCHEINAGRMLRGDRLSQGHGNGYPAYRLQWQALGSLHRRLRFCNQGIRAEPFAHGAPEYVALELFLAWRAQTLLVETPAVRR